MLLSYRFNYFSNSWKVLFWQGWEVKKFIWVWFVGTFCSWKKLAIYKLSKILRLYEKRLSKTRQTSAQVLRTVNAIKACRTSKLGGHKQKYGDCAAGFFSHFFLMKPNNSAKKLSRPKGWICLLGIVIESFINILE